MLSKGNFDEDEDDEVDDSDEFGLGYDEGIGDDDFGNLWEGMLEKQVGACPPPPPQTQPLGFSMVAGFRIMRG